jgi:hypothetical protein
MPDASTPEAAPNGVVRTDGGAGSLPLNEAIEADRNPIFDNLVGSEGEVAGLVAYSIYKQNKRAWLDDFIKATGRTPTEAETRSYIIGENTERRLAIYRQLAAAALGGQTLRIKGAVPVVRPRRLAPTLLALAALVAMMFVGLAMRYIPR